MSEELHLPEGGTREDIYRAILPQIEAVIAGVEDLIANLANVAAILKQAFAFPLGRFLPHDCAGVAHAWAVSGAACLRDDPFRQRRVRRGGQRAKRR